MLDKKLVEELINPTIKHITLWYRCNSKDNSYEYNHFEETKDNHLFYSINKTIEKPTPTIIIQNSIQKSWKSNKWKYTLGKLNTKTNKIIEESDLI